MEIRWAIWTAVQSKLLFFHAISYLLLRYRYVEGTGRLQWQKLPSRKRLHQWRSPLSGHRKRRWKISYLRAYHKVWKEKLIWGIYEKFDRRYGTVYGLLKWHWFKYFQLNIVNVRSGYLVSRVRGLRLIYARRPGSDLARKLISRRQIEGAFLWSNPNRDWFYLLILRSCFKTIFHT